jgi:hypothetical protein
MTIRVYKVAEIVSGEIMFSTQQKFRQGDLMGVLTCLEPPDDPIPESAWTVELLVEYESETRRIRIDLAPTLRKSDPLDSPLLLGENVGGGPLIYFRDRLFAPERPPRNHSDWEEVVLRVKKAVYDEESEISSLRSAVSDLEAAIRFQKSDAKRVPIPEHVKLLVWARDGGSCVYCGSKQSLHFDHIIPISKGGDNSSANVQILCQACNLKKSDKIAVP